MAPPRDEDRRRTDSVEVDGTRVSFGGQTADQGCVLTSYAAVLRAVRNSRGGAALQLRTADLEVLALAVGADGHDVEARIRSLLGCSADEAKRVHRELVRRHLLRPVAMLAVGTAIVWGPAAAASGDRPTLGEFEPAPASVEVERGTGPQMTGDEIPTSAPLPGIPAEAATTTVTAPSATIATAGAALLPGDEIAEPASPSSAPTSTIAPAESEPAESSAADSPDVGIPAGETPTLIIES